MKARLLGALALLVLCAASGCNTVNLCDGCHGGRHGGHHGGRHGGHLLGRHGGHGFGHLGGGAGGGGGSGVADGRDVNYGHHFTRNYDGPPGPATAQVGYPYYTTRGPRDFLTNNPPSIGN